MFWEGDLWKKQRMISPTHCQGQEDITPRAVEGLSMSLFGACWKGSQLSLLHS